MIDNGAGLRQRGGVGQRRRLPGKALSSSGGGHSWRGCTMQWNMARRGQRHGGDGGRLGGCLPTAAARSLRRTLPAARRDTLPALFTYIHPLQGCNSSQCTSSMYTLECNFYHTGRRIKHFIANYIAPNHRQAAVIMP